MIGRNSAALFAACLVAPAVQAAEPADVLARVYSELLVADMFNDFFVAQIPLPDLHKILMGLRAETGPLQEVRKPQGSAADEFEIITKTHVIPAKIALDGQGRIAGLFFAPPELRHVSRDYLDKAITALAGKVSVYGTRDGAVMIDENGSAPLAVASTFKIGVLAELAAQVAAGERAWSDVVTLQDHHRSLPSGIMQDWPVGAHVTLHTAATLMISISDNTATDLLLDLVGRDAVADRLGLDQVLSVREVFGLKGDIALRTAYIIASPEERPKIASVAAQTLPDMANVGPHNKGVEWYIPAPRICDVMGDVAHLDMMKVSLGPLTPGRWADWAFKGGSEGGVLNLSAQVTDAQGRALCAVVTVNSNDAINEQDTARVLNAVLGYMEQN